MYQCIIMNVSCCERKIQSGIDKPSSSHVIESRRLTTGQLFVDHASPQARFPSKRNRLRWQAFVALRNARPLTCMRIVPPNCSVTCQAWQLKLKRNIRVQSFLLCKPNPIDFQPHRHSNIYHGWYLNHSIEGVGNVCTVKRREPWQSFP